MKKKTLFFKIALICVACFVVIYIISLQIQLRSLQKERDSLKEIVDDYQMSIAEMEHELLLPKEEYIAKYAREVLGYHKHSDIIFKEKTN
ncbi:MAG: septum formation initiator family protein [Clostridia bacterium]|nr:septum formation initiator family protein [Clostridia bacterium]